MLRCLNLSENVPLTFLRISRTMCEGLIVCVSGPLIHRLLQECSSPLHTKYFNFQFYISDTKIMDMGISEVKTTL
jgi:hypothetical protein